MVKNEDVKSIDSETVTLLSNIARLKDEDKFGLLPWLCEKDLGVWQSDEDQIKQNAQDVNSVVLVKTKLNNPRIRAQYGSFFLFGYLSNRILLAVFQPFFSASLYQYCRDRCYKANASHTALLDCRPRQRQRGVGQFYAN